jgi:hypothetical protein
MQKYINTTSIKEKSKGDSRKDKLKGESMSKVPKKVKELQIIADILSEPLAIYGLGEHIAT